jgi:hypothetical protein
MFGVWNVTQSCGENRVGLKWKEAVTGAYKRKGYGLRSAISVSRCSHNVTGALLGCRFHNPKVESFSSTIRHTQLFEDADYFCCWYQEKAAKSVHCQIRRRIVGTVGSFDLCAM